MSDRRPSKLWELCEHGNFECWEKRDLGINVTPTMVRCKGAREASPVDLLAAVRRGVESGTIKGKMAECLECNSEGVTSCRPFPCEHGGHTCAVCRGVGRVLVIPIAEPEPPYRQIGKWTRTTNG